MNNETFPKKLVPYRLRSDHRKRLAHFFILFLWAVIHYSLGNRFYSLYIIAFFLALILYRPPNFMLLAVSVLVLVLFSAQTIDTLSALKQSNVDIVQNPNRTLTNIFSPNSAPEAKPGDDLQLQVQNMLSLLKKHDVANYRLSDLLHADSQIFMRITVAAWPIKMENASSHVLTTMYEIKNYSTCSRIDKIKDIALVYCH